MKTWIVAALIASAPSLALAHAGEDHGEPASAAVAAALPRASAATSELELVAVAEKDRLVLYLDRYATNEPVAGAKLELESPAARGPAAEAAPGSYVFALSGPLPPGRHGIAVVVDTAGTADLLSLTLDMPPAPAAAAAPASSAWTAWTPWKLWGGSGALLIAGAGVLALRRRTVRRGAVAALPVVLGSILAGVLAATAAPAAIAHGGEDHAAPPPKTEPAATAPAAAAPAATPSEVPQRLADGSLFVPKPVQRHLGVVTEIAAVRAQAGAVELNGKVVADPASGGRVQAAQAGRLVAGPKGLPRLGQRVARGERLAILQPTATSLDRGNQQAQLAEIEAQLAIAERKSRRYDELEGFVSAREIEAARFELEALRKRRTAVAASLSAPEPLIAPSSGVVSAVNAVAGQVVEAKEVLFEIVDPGQLLVEALAYDMALAEGIASAGAVLGDRNLLLELIGAGRQLREQALPLLFRVRGGGALAAVGQPVKVIARTLGGAPGAALPQSALARNDAGQTVVWVHFAPERFAARPVRASPLDAGTVNVTSGLKDGERVVVDGAGLLSQVR